MAPEPQGQLGMLGMLGGLLPGTGTTLAPGVPGFGGASSSGSSSGRVGRGRDGDQAWGHTQGRGRCQGVAQGVAHLHAAVVDDNGLEFDLGVQLGHLLAALQEQPVPQLPAAGNTGKGRQESRETLKAAGIQLELGSVTPFGAPHPAFPPPLSP